MTEPAVDRESAARDVRLVREVLERTQRRVDPHAFHFVAWGAIVSVWYPLANLFERSGRMDLYAATGAVAIVLGTGLSFALERRLRRRFGASRVGAEESVAARQVAAVTAVCIAGGVALSALGPALGFIEGRDVPTLWGLVYAAMASMYCVVYSREWLWAGAGIFAGAVAAMAFPDWNGVILGPVMGLGMIVPGVVAERRVRRMAESRIAS